MWIVVKVRTSTSSSVKFSLWDNWGLEQKGMQMYRLDRMTINGKQELTTYLLGCDSHKICSIYYGMVLMRPRFGAPCCLQSQSSALFSDLCWQERLREYTCCQGRMHRYWRWSKSRHFCWAFHSNVPVILATGSVQAYILMWTKPKCLYIFFLLVPSLLCSWILCWQFHSWWCLAYNIQWKLFDFSWTISLLKS